MVTRKWFDRELSIWCPGEHKINGWTVTFEIISVNHNILKCVLIT